MMLSIGTLSKQVSVKVATIRYYESIGLLPQPERTAGNQRRYSAQARERLAFIRHARDLGFSIEAIRDLIDLYCHPESPCGAADRIAAEQLSAVRDRIAKLRRLEAELERIATGCEASSAGECYVLEALGDHRLCRSEH